MNFQVDDALRGIRERITDTNSDIHHVATEITFLQMAANEALAALDTEVERYNQNLKILLQEYDKKQLDQTATAASSGRPPPRVEPLVYNVEPLVDNNAQILREAVGARGDVEHRAGYEWELWRYWRHYGGQAEASHYEQLWEWVQRRRMPTLL